MQTILVNNLDGDELNYWVAKAQNLEVVGKFLAHYDPESGYPEFDDKQQERSDGCLKTHWRYFYINECYCEVSAEIEKESREHWENNFPDTPYRGHARFAGHDYQCFQPVLDYCSMWRYGGNIIEKFNIGIEPVGKIDEEGQCHQWQGSYRDDSGRLHYIKAHTALLAIMRSLVASRFGEVIEVTDNLV